jgi:glycosyltransferase involved in cell wall biosynthesis
MRVLFDHPNPFVLAHGGFQIQIEQTYAGLRRIGVEVEHLRWWDDAQKGDIIHYFGRPPLPYLDLARQKGMKVILAQLLTGVGSRGPWALRAEKWLIASGRRLLPYVVSSRFGWDAFRRSDACLGNTPWEAHLMEYVFGAPRERVFLFPNGVEETFLNSTPEVRGQWLVCSATITERKRVLELAEAAVLARTPLWVVGRPYADNDPYARRFLELAARHPRLLRYEGAIRDRSALARAYREARGFVLLSTMETRSLASEEAAACECPLLLSDLPWARSVFGDSAWYCGVGLSAAQTAQRLRDFYDAAPGIKPPPKPLSWDRVAEQLRGIYTTVLNRPG